MSVTVTTLQEGSGEGPLKGDTVVMHYTGWLKDTSQPENKGRKFDSSLNPGREEFRTPIGKGRVIKGWDHGVATMKVGGKARLDITSGFAYGSSGVGGGLIPGNADLIFDVELLNIIPASDRQPWGDQWFKDVILN